MEVPRLGVKSDLELLADTTPTKSPGPSRICDPHHSSWQHQITDLLSKTRNGTCTLMDTSRICFCCATTGTPSHLPFLPSHVNALLERGNPITFSLSWLPTAQLVSLPLKHLQSSHQSFCFAFIIHPLCFHQHVTRQKTKLYHSLEILLQAISEMSLPSPPRSRPLGPALTVLYRLP